MKRYEVHSGEEEREIEREQEKRKKKERKTQSKNKMKLLTVHRCSRETSSQTAI